MKKFEDYILFLTIFLFFYYGNAQNLVKNKHRDTIFFKVEENYFIKGKYNQDQYYIKDALEDKGSTEVFFFKIITVDYRIKTDQVCNLKEYIRSSNYYYKKRNINRLDDFALASHLQNFIIYLVDFNYLPNKYLKVYPMTEVE